jgi:deazaflavin-dependent oxidoreductase (nitroreductase family)
MSAPTYRVTLFVTVSNAIVTLLLRLGIRLGPMTLLTVRGRTSGVPRTTPVVVVEQDHQRWLVAPFGNVNWVRNLRAAGQAQLSRGRRSERIQVDEIGPAEAGPFLKRMLQARRAPKFVTQYFDVTADSPVEDFVRESPRHPVFRIRAAASGVESVPASAGVSAAA